MSRSLSHTEISKALRCMAQHDFAYGNVLAGSSLKKKRLAPGLSLGRAWGAGVAAWHQAASAEQPDLLTPEVHAEDAIVYSLNQDAQAQRELGTHDEAQHVELLLHARNLLVHYSLLAKPLDVERLEARYDVPIPSRNMNRGSSRYRFLGFVDARLRSEPWLVEFKLRGQLWPASLIVRSRQTRYYAWAHWRATGERPAGVLVDERLNMIPSEPRIVQAKSKREGIDGYTVSHAQNQTTTSDLYLRACAAYHATPDQLTIRTLDQRRWQQRVPVIFRDGELEEAGEELTAAAQIIGQLDRGLYPIRNASRSTCNFCDFNDICDDPASSVVDELFDRVPAKRDRALEAV